MKTPNPKNEKCKFVQGDEIKIVSEDFGTMYGVFHRYGASKSGAIVFIGDDMRFVDEDSLSHL